MIEELVHKYQVSRKLARTWVEIDQILPLLDGLDEVATENRTKCIETINTYHQKHPFLPLVVTSRSADYLAQTERVRLASAVTIRSLTRQQVDDYLASGGEPLWALQVALHQDAALRELTETPLMLSILTLTYHDMPVEDLLRGGITPTRQQIFEHYVERMLSRRGTTPSYSSLQTRGWLAWLARQMKQQSQTVFYLERLQPDWLGDRHRRLLYRLSVGPVVGLVVGPLFGLVCSLITGLIGILFIPGGLVLALIAGPIYGLFSGLVGGLVGGLVFGLGQIQPREVLTRSWRWTKRSNVIGLVVGLVFGLGYGLVFGLGNGLVGGLVSGLVVGLVVGLIAMLGTGFSMSQLDDRMRFTPNQGIWRSARNGLVVGLFVWLFVGLIGALVVGLIGALVVGLFDGLIIGLIAMLSFGLGPFFQHFALRFWLWRSRAIPWNYPRFLDYTTEHILLSKVGGGYIFVHRLLLDYFASLDTTSTPDAARAKR